MWDEVGVTREAKGLRRGLAQIDMIEEELLATGLAEAEPAYNITWQEWLNLRSLCECSRVIALAALRRENSRGAHYRTDFPEPGDLATSRFTVARQVDGQVEIAEVPVRFTRVKPRESGKHMALGAEGSKLA